MSITRRRVHAVTTVCIAFLLVSAVLTSADGRGDGNRGWNGRGGWWGGDPWRGGLTPASPPPPIRAPASPPPPIRAPASPPPAATPPPASPPPPPPPAVNDPVSFYSSACPAARNLVASTVQSAVQNDRGLPAALLRMQFHDCFVRGCDASILLDSTQSSLAEKDGVGNAFSVRGYEVIDAVKSAVENVCPGVVSCADIVALATRDAIVSIGGPSWKVVSGRRDGLVSLATETPSNLPPPNADYAFLVNRFTRKGLTEKEMVVLSGAHTIGVTHCGMIAGRLYNNTGPNGVDPTLDATYGAALQQQCPFGQNVMTEVKLDPTNGGNAFDSVYYTNIQDKKVLFSSDATLISTAAGRSLVQAEATGSTVPFFADFAAAMENLINIQVLTAPAGEIRQNCRSTN
ncbi:peroxidase [Marchantia polymorpha subsp. ruderalis]|uniref:Peroxidase n=2 Tax=Marchantia polymorpha TaxID=3197 RepID=A0AAF6BER2_MARPO|nr:hypothetical protein MARPO_0141s0009 [Marchantia polymorpha]BBN10496.1 hypothetical protein Mp_5g04010 [Marchantia polymorpha subsp. ruderalis]|eukprot:PTQ29426.1 hypothetical protein MARPO_0141s0009 [Marchantia polymorpha]